MVASENIVIGEHTVRVSDEVVTRTVKFLQFGNTGVKRPVEDVWKLLSVIDPARLPLPITIKIDDEELRAALEDLKVIKTIQRNSYAGKLYYNFIAQLSALMAGAAI